jgi:hypothetical protein
MPPMRKHDGSPLSPRADEAGLTSKDLLIAITFDGDSACDGRWNASCTAQRWQSETGELDDQAEPGLGVARPHDGAPAS